MAENNILKINGSIQVNDVVSINGTPEISETSIQAVRGKDLQELKDEINSIIQGLDSYKEASSGYAISSITQEDGKIKSIKTTDAVNKINVTLESSVASYGIYIGKADQAQYPDDSNVLLFLID